MTQQTRVLTLDAPAAAALERDLREGLSPAAEWRRVPHARFSVKDEGTVVTCYLSGKVVVQGADPDAIIARFAPDAAAAPDAEPPMALDTPTIGSDEAGKGDYFGPLVVAAVFALPGDAARLRAAGVTDSKRLSDVRALQLAGWLERELDCAVRCLEPPVYNEHHARSGNLNAILADLHGQVIAELAQRHPEATTVVVDRFGAEDLVARRVGGERRLVQVPRGERHPAVAAASVVARAGFLDGLRRAGTEIGVDLPKGAGEPAERTARELGRLGGRPLLAKVAKLHFKTTDRVLS